MVNQNFMLLIVAHDKRSFGLVNRGGTTVLVIALVVLWHKLIVSFWAIASVGANVCPRNLFCLPAFPSLLPQKNKGGKHTQTNK